MQITLHRVFQQVSEAVCSLAANERYKQRLQKRAAAFPEEQSFRTLQG